MIIRYIKKSFNYFFWILDKIWKNGYIKYYPRYLRWLGIDIETEDTVGMWISPTVFFDSTRYGWIKIGKRVTISFDVAILVHDFSIAHAARAEGRRCKDVILGKVSIGENVFIGARSLILPGTEIGSNCIIGGASVVKGKLESNGIYAGNPAKKISTIDQFLEKYKDLIS